MQLFTLGGQKWNFLKCVLKGKVAGNLIFNVQGYYSLGLLGMNISLVPSLHTPACFFSPTMCEKKLGSGDWEEFHHVFNGGPRTRVGQPKMKYWKLDELHKNEV